jgi:hypothetical protein
MRDGRPDRVPPPLLAGRRRTDTPEQAARAGDRAQADDPLLLALADEREQLLDGPGRPVHELAEVRLKLGDVAAKPFWPSAEQHGRDFV